MNKIEKILFYIFIVTTLISIAFAFPGLNTILVISGSILSLAFFFFGFAIYNDISFRQVFKNSTYQTISSLRVLGSVGAGFFTSLLIIGILFKVMFWPGSYTNLIFGILGLFIILVIVAIKKSKLNYNVYNKVINRSSILLLIALPLIFISNQALAKFKYRNDPEYSKAMINTMDEPDNLEYQQQLLEIRNKRDAEQ